MKLFDGFKVVKFAEENLLFVTHHDYLYYIYNPKYDSWKKHSNAGNDSITVRNYKEVTKEEVINAMHGTFPTKETDFMRLCDASQLCIRDMMNLLYEDYSEYMSDGSICQTVHIFLYKSNIIHKSFLKLKILFDNARSLKNNKEEVLTQIKELCFAVIGRDIFKREIGIVDGHNGSSYFWIMPVRVIDDTDTNEIDNIAEMRSAEISIEENDVSKYLTPFLYKYFDDGLEANRKRVFGYWEDDDGNEQTNYTSGFEWYLTHNFYSFDSITNILNAINDTIDALSCGSNNEFTEKLRENRGTATNKMPNTKDLSPEQINEYNANRKKEDDAEIKLIIDFYHRFIFRMEYMMKVGKEKGYNLISFTGP